MTTKRRAKGEGSLFQRHGARYGCPPLEKTEEGQTRPQHRCRAPWAGRANYQDDDGQWQQAAVQAATKTEAKDKLDALLKRLKKGMAPRDSTAKFGAYAEAWAVTTLAISSRKQSTKDQYANRIKTSIVGTILGNAELGKVTPNTVETWLAELARVKEPATVNGAFIVARLVMKTAVRDKLVAENPFDGINPSRGESGEAVALDSGQTHRVLDEMAGTRHHSAAVILFHTAMRVGELCGLSWPEVDLPAKVARVKDAKTKSGNRPVPLDEDAIAAFEFIRARTDLERAGAANKWVGDNRVILSPLGKPVHTQAITYAINKAGEKSGVTAELTANDPDVTSIGSHTARHTAASLMLANGVPMSTVKEILGHGNIATTIGFYSHVSPEVKHDAIDVLSKALRRPEAS